MEERLSQQRAPVFEALKRFQRMRVVPFDVPGHKRGKGTPELTAFLGEQCMSVDVNSMKPLDNLCHPVSVIKEAEELAAQAFGAENAFFMVNGTTSAVQSMVLAACKKGEKIILPRNVHRSVINALVLSGAEPVYVNPEMNHKLGIALGMSVAQVEKAILENPSAKAVLVNNPTYYGVCSNLRAITELAHRHNMLVLADKGTPAECRAMAEAVIADGSAFEKCKQMFAAQGGDTRVLDDYSLFAKPAASYELLAEQDGYIIQNDAEKIGSASVLLGAGRQKKGDPLDFAAGIVLHKKRGATVHKGESLATFYGAPDKFAAAAEEYRSGLVYGDTQPEEAPLVYALVTKDGVERYDQ